MLKQRYIPLLKSMRHGPCIQMHIISLYQQHVRTCSSRTGSLQCRPIARIDRERIRLLTTLEWLPLARTDVKYGLL